MQNLFPENNIVGKAKLDKKILGSPDWQAAKEQHDYEAARRIVAGLWSSKKTEQLRRFFKDSSNVIFVSQPTSSGNNILPVVFAKKLSVDFDTGYVIGDDFFSCLHEQQSKYIPKYQRPFHRREYAAENIEVFRRLVGNKDVVVVEDVLTTGGSVAQFVGSLNEERVEVKSVVALMGDKRLNIDSKTLDRLSGSLNKADIPISANELSKELTRSEAGIIIVAANNTRLPNARKKLTRNLQGILHQSSYKNLGRDQDPGRYKGPERSNISHEATTERISPGRVLGIGRTGELKETHHFEISVKEVSGQTYTKQLFVNPRLVSRNDLNDYLKKKGGLFVSSLGIEKQNISEINIRPVVVKEINCATKNIEREISH